MFVVAEDDEAAAASEASTVSETVVLAFPPVPLLPLRFSGSTRSLSSDAEHAAPLPLPLPPPLLPRRGGWGRGGGFLSLSLSLSHPLRVSSSSRRT